VTTTNQSHSHENASIRAILYAFVANLGIALIKSWAALYTGSGSMLAEAIHSFADSGNQVLLFIGLKQAQKPADTEHPLGYGKISYFYSFIVALMLFSIGGLFSIYEGIHKFQNPEPLNQLWVALAVLSVAVCLEAAAMFGVLREVARLRGAKPIRLWLKTTRNAELVVVLGEDFAALTGLAFALVFVGLAAVTGDPVYDAIGSMCIGVVLIFVSIFVALRIRDLLIGKSAEPELRQEMDELIKADPVILRLFNVITFQMGPKVLLAAKVKLPPDMTIETAVTHLNQLEKRLKERRPEIGWIFIEPDITD
jgi:cation diffusion facilitator family transporter